MSALERDFADLIERQPELLAHHLTSVDGILAEAVLRNMDLFAAEVMPHLGN